MSKKSLFEIIARRIAGLFILFAIFISCEQNGSAYVPIILPPTIPATQPENKVLVERAVTRIISFNGSLWFASSKLYKKDAESSSSSQRYNGQWTLVDAKNGQSDLVNISSIATDGSYFYCSTTENVNGVSFKRVFRASDGETFNQINISSITGFGDENDSYAKDTDLFVFDNRAGDGSNSFTGRKVFVRLWNKNGGTDGKGAYEIHELSGNSVNGTIASGSDSKSVSAAYFPGNTIFSESLDMIFCNGMGYKASGSSVQYSTDGSDWTSVNLNKGKIYSLALTDDYLLFGTENGIFRSSLTSGVPSSAIADFSNNAGTLLKSKVTGLYVFDYSSNEGSNDEYCIMPASKYVSSSSEKVEEIGVYAYYPDKTDWLKDID